LFIGIKREYWDEHPQKYFSITIGRFEVRWFLGEERVTFEGGSQQPIDPQSAAILRKLNEDLFKVPEIDRSQYVGLGLQVSSGLH